MSIMEERSIENEQIKERYDLAMERIGQITSEEQVQEPYRDYFYRGAEFIGLIGETAKKMCGSREDGTLEELTGMNRRLYQDILPENYEHSYGNPAYAVKLLGQDFGQMLCFFYTQLRGGIIFAYEGRMAEITILCETFIEIYNLFEQGTPEVSEVRHTLYWFVSDYSDQTVTYRVRETLDPELDFAKRIIMESDLGDLRYLYRFGDYISDTERKLAKYMNALPEDMVEKMADTYVDGYCRGFEVMGRELGRKKTVGIRYELGFERMIRRAVEKFREKGLEPVICRAAVWSINQNAGRKIGYHSSSPNKQYDYDHRFDNAMYLDKALKDRRIAVLKTAYETYKQLAADYAGPAVVETFGEEGFSPVNKPEAYRLSKKQEELTIAYANESMPVVNAYVPGDETSFTIIAFPVPEIGARFPEIFEDTIRINTLDYEKYKCIQQCMIDVLDEAEYVTVTGRGVNETDMRVRLHPLQDRAKETNFENCVADVNIPLGEVFTSPLLTGTSGLLHVGNVYIGEFCFKNLRMRFEDGKVTAYSCDNFADQEEGKALIRQQILKNHETLPLGEFAIGTNTTAYAMAQKYDIVEKLPILIAEKMGPHFAVGDTCYSWSEDSPMYNPDGKEVIARDNEISIMRKEDVSNAYFGCHTDITIPYSELGDICAVRRDGTKIMIIREGRFVCPGTESLNYPIDGISKS